MEMIIFIKKLENATNIMLPEQAENSISNAGGIYFGTVE
jgi:hypothetical protein